jgi:hypothetical protein
MQHATPKSWQPRGNYQMITELFLKDFKAFHHERIPLRPLTVLIGENNSGKSSVLAAIRLMAQTAQYDDPSVPLLFDGPFGDFGAFRDMVHGNIRARPMMLGLTVPYVTQGTKSSSGDRHVKLVCDFKYRLQRREVIQRSARMSLDGQPLLTVGRTDTSERMNLEAIGGIAIPPNLKSSASKGFRMNNFVPYVSPLVFYERGGQASELFNSIRKDRSYRNAPNSISTALRAVEAIGAMREAPLRTYLHTGAVGSHIGLAGENWGSHVALADSGRGRRNYMTKVKSWIRKAGIADSLDIDWLSDRHFEIKVRHPVSGESENISDVGRGTSQVLPVIVGGYRLKAGDTYLVEEPEIHLHPRAQAALGDYFLDLTQSGIQTILETHSEYLIMRIQQHVASGRLSASDVVFYYLQATNEGKEIVPLNLNSDAVFETQIPGGFFPQRMQEATNLARARGKSEPR